MLQKEQERLQLLQEDYNRTPAQRLLKEIQEAKKHIPQLQEQLSKATGSAQDGAVVTSSKPLGDPLTVSEVEADPGDGLGRIDSSSGDASRPSSDSADSPKSALKERIYLEENPEKSEVTQDTDTQSLIGSPSPRIAPHIIGAEDDDFGTEHEQINGQCSCFQSIELLKSRPAHLAVFLHHVVSQFDPATLLCYLYSDLYKQTNSKETRRVFLEFHQFFLDRSAVSYQLILYNLCCSTLSYWTPTSSLPSPGFGLYCFGLSDVCTVSQLLITLDHCFYHF